MPRTENNTNLFIALFSNCCSRQAAVWIHHVQRGQQTQVTKRACGPWGKKKAISRCTGGYFIITLCSTKQSCSRAHSHPHSHPHPAVCGVVPFPPRTCVFCNKKGHGIRVGSAWQDIEWEMRVACDELAGCMNKPPCVQNRRQHTKISQTQRLLATAKLPTRLYFGFRGLPWPVFTF